MSAQSARLAEAPETRERLVLVTASPTLKRFAQLPGEYHARIVSGWSALDVAVETAPPSVTVLADPYAGRGPRQGLAPELRELLLRRPSIPVVAALALRPERAADAALLFDWGVADVLDLEVETTPKFVQARLRGVRARPLKRRIEAVLSSYASEYARNMLRAACEVTVEGGGAPELARLFRVEARTMAGWCRREGLPAPRRLLAWMRVLLAATLLEEDGRSVVNAARGAGYATDHALRRAMRDLIGGDPSTLGRDRLFADGGQRFNSELRVLREAARERRRPLLTGRPSPLYN